MEKEFKEILREFLKINSMSQGAFARKIGAKPGQVSEWLVGKAKPGYDYLRAISKAFDNINYFLGLSDY